jgi:hypothetical protein
VPFAHASELRVSGFLGRYSSDWGMHAALSLRLTCSSFHNHLKLILR